MTTRHTIELETFSLALFVAAAGVIFAFYNHGPKIRTVFNLPVVSALVTPTPSDTPTPTPQTFTEVAPNGLKKMTMTVTSGKLTTTYKFSVSNPDGSSPTTIYTTNLPTSESMSIPYNAFSPDNTYVFVQHTMPSGTEALVFQANGTPFSSDSPYYNVTQLYIAHATGNTYDTTTGWASDTLLVILTKNVQGQESTSYWLELPDKALIPLSTQF